MSEIRKMIKDLPVGQVYYDPNTNCFYEKQKEGMSIPGEFSTDGEFWLEPSLMEVLHDPELEVEPVEVYSPFD